MKIVHRSIRIALTILLVSAGPMAGAAVFRVVQSQRSEWVHPDPDRRVEDRLSDDVMESRTGRPLIMGIWTTVLWELMAGLALLRLWRTRGGDRGDQTNLMQTVLHNLVDGVIVADTRGKLLFVNKAARDIAGTKRMDVSPSEWSHAYGLFVPGTGEPIPQDEQPLVRVIRGEEVKDVEVFVRNAAVPDGALLSVNGAPLKNKDGAFRGGVVVFRDISRRRQAEDWSRRLSNAVEQTADAVFITDRAGTIEYVNPALETITGFSREEVLDANPRILKSGVQEEEYYRDLWSTILAGRPFKGTTVNRRKDGELYWAEQTITPMTDSNGQITHFVSVFKDMTERRRIQEQEIEMKIASMVQRRLFPASAPQLRGYDIHGAVFPSEATCGDYFDFIAMSDDRLAIAVADVSGHGVGPALVMSETRAYLRSLLQTCADPGEILREINDVLVDDLDDGFFVTLLLARLDTKTGSLVYANAGHPAGMVVAHCGTVTATMKATGIPLGLYSDQEYTSSEVTLHPGELVMFLTDGILESRSPQGEEFSEKRASEVVRRVRRERSSEIVDVLYREARSFASGQRQEDDITIVVCKRENLPEVE